MTNREIAKKALVGLYAIKEVPVGTVLHNRDGTSVRSPKCQNSNIQSESFVR